MTTLTSWPFWAPSDLEAVEHALDLASAKAGDRVIDLGCGDGQVLVAAAQRGCVVAGVESDGDLVESARRALAENDLDGDVQQGDVFDYPLDADVLFTYLAPATLQRLAPRLQRARPGTRLVTVDFAIADLEPDEVDGRNHLYRLPARPAWQRSEPSWGPDAVLVAAPPERHSLSCITLRHRGGPVDVRVSGDLVDMVTVQTGADEARPGGAVAVDLRWEEIEDGGFLVGALDAPGAGVDPLAVYVLITEQEHGLWEVNAEGARRLARRITGGWVPGSFDELLAACDG